MPASNTLEHREEFVAALTDYQVSPAARELLAKLRMVLLIGPTSSGRNTIINELLKTGDYHFIVSDTTRQPRENNGILEQDGREYWFRQEADMLQDIQSGNFLEAAVIHNQQVSGISIRELTRAADAGLIAINEIEIVGGDNIHAVKPDTKFLFILPPSFDEWMVRMNGRGQLPEDEIRRRLESAVEEIRVALDRDFYQFVVNDTFKQTAEHIHDLITADTPFDDQHGREVAAQVLADTEAHLADRDS